MYKNYKIVVNTAAGRRRYMQYLVPYILSEDIVDRYDIWVHTHNGADIEFFKLLAENYPKVNLIMQPDGLCKGNETINPFYKYCCDEDTIYFKLDDDICWMEKDAIRKMVEFRINNPDYFIVSPLVINNPLCTYLLQISEKLKLNKYVVANPYSEVFWKSGDFAKSLHKWFLERYVENDAELPYVGKHEWALNRLSINAILWFGKDLKPIHGIVPGDDEDFISCIYPTIIGKANCVNGDCIVSHFAFFTQREILDNSNILNCYGDASHKYWMKNNNMKSIDETVQKIILNISENEKKLMARPSPYKQDLIGSNSLKHHINIWLKKHCPILYKKINNILKEDEEVIVL